MNRLLSTGWETYAYSRHNKIPTDKPGTCFRAIMILLIIQFATLQAQSAEWIDLEPEDWTLEVSSGYFYEGDTVVYKVLLGDASSQVSNLIAIKLSLELSDWALLPIGMVPDSTDSWLFADGEFDYDVEHDVALHDLEILAERGNETSVTGYGKVFSFSLICNGNDLKASDLIQTEGGIILVENIELKRASLPSPMVSDNLVNPVILVEVIGLEQRRGYREDWEMKNGESPQISRLLPGLYYLKETMLDGNCKTRKILVR